MTERTRSNRITKAKQFLNKLKHEEEPRMLLFTSDEKNFFLVQEVNCKKLGGCIKSPKRI